MATGKLPYETEIVHLGSITALGAYGCTGVYFLWHEGVVVYVGQGRNMRRRIGTHIAEWVKVFDSISCVRCHVKELDRIERRFIAALRPKYNQAGLPVDVRLARKLGFEEPPQKDTGNIRRRRRDVMTPDDIAKPRHRWSNRKERRELTAEQRIEARS
jgi:hypothetical protein